MAKSKPQGSKQDRQWIEAKQRCRLNQEDIRMAKELGLKPRALIKNIPSPNQQWKLRSNSGSTNCMKKNPEKLMQKRALVYSLSNTASIMYLTLFHCMPMQTNLR